MFEKELNNPVQKKVFIVTGELSGDKTAAWFVKKESNSNVYYQSVGGDSLAACGVDLFQRFEKLNVVGIIEIVRHLPFILKFMRQLVDHIKSNGFDEVVLVDFPGFNLRLAKKLKSEIPGIKITYLAPPQLWCWGAWRVKKIKNYCDRVVVLYPFEVQWYAQRGVTAEWIGNPVYDEMSQYFDQDDEKENLIALIPGSRVSEIKRFMPFFADIVNLFLKHYPDVKFVMPVAESLSEDFLKAEMAKVGLTPQKITILQSDKNKFKILKSCCLAITKPGTVTLELALLGVPAVVFFKISWLTYIIGRSLIRVRFMSLPNLLTGSNVYKECIQGDCNVRNIFQSANAIYQSFKNGGEEYKAFIDRLHEIRNLLGLPRL